MIKELLKLKKEIGAGRLTISMSGKLVDITAMALSGGKFAEETVEITAKELQLSKCDDYKLVRERLAGFAAATKLMGASQWPVCRGARQ